MVADSSSSEQPSSISTPLFYVERDKDEGRSAITRRNAVESPLLRLPPEVRNIIYFYLFGDTIVLGSRIICDSCLKTEQGRQPAATVASTSPNSHSSLVVRVTWSSILDLPPCDYCNVMWEHYQSLCLHELAHFEHTLALGKKPYIPHPRFLELYAQMKEALPNLPNGASDLIACPRHFRSYSSSSSASSSSSLSPSSTAAESGIPTPWPFPAAAMRACRQMAVDCRPIVHNSYQSMLSYRGPFTPIANPALPGASLALTGIRTLHIKLRRVLKDLDTPSSLRVLSVPRKLLPEVLVLSNPTLLRACLPALQEVRIATEEDVQDARTLVGNATGWLYGCRVKFRPLLFWVAGWRFSVLFEIKPSIKVLELAGEGRKVCIKGMEVFRQLEAQVNNQIVHAQQHYKDLEARGFFGSEEDDKELYWHPGTRR